MAGGNEDIPAALRDCVIDNIRIGKQIGRGANGRILEAKWEGIIVAVKEIHSIFMNEISDREFQWFKKSFLRECEQSSRLLVSRGQTAFFRFSLEWRKKGSGPVHRPHSS